MVNVWLSDRLLFITLIAIEAGKKVLLAKVILAKIGMGLLFFSLFNFMFMCLYVVLLMQ
jgi:hypothetical protein